MHAARALGFLCFADVAKDQAIVEGAVPRLIALLKQQPTDVRVAATSALMAITSTDEGKRQILPCGGVPFLLELLFDSSRIVQINTLKIIANAAVFPPIRKILREDEECLSTLKIMAEGWTLSRRSTQLLRLMLPYGCRNLNRFCSRLINSC